MTADRNFDNLAERFERRVHHSLKGRIKRAVLRRDIEGLLGRNYEGDQRVIDLGAGLGHFSIALAKKGWQVHYSDISNVMALKARMIASEKGLEKTIFWHVGRYQHLVNDSAHQGKYGLILCHALLEWLRDPEDLFPALSVLASDNAYLSLCFYNPVGREYRNLIRGNFDWLEKQEAYLSDQGSLTPNNALSIERVRELLLAHDFVLLEESGIRVFSDYAVERRGGLQDESQVINMELAYSRREPYKFLGRYYHMIARKQ